MVKLYLTLLNAKPIRGLISREVSKPLKTRNVKSSLLIDLMIIPSLTTRTNIHNQLEIIIYKMSQLQHSLPGMTRDTRL
jgi:hypothetical protein